MDQNGNPVAGALPYADAIWIKRYNGASPQDYLYWNTKTTTGIPAWQLYPLNTLVPPFDYVGRVCGTGQ